MFIVSSTIFITGLVNPQEPISLITTEVCVLRKMIAPHLNMIIFKKHMEERLIIIVEG